MGEIDDSNTLENDDDGAAQEDSTAILGHPPHDRRWWMTMISTRQASRNRPRRTLGLVIIPVCQSRNLKKVMP